MLILLDSLLQESMTSTLSKEDYLKRYLSGGQDDSDKTKKKKKKKNKDKIPVKALPNVRIIDNDVAFPDAEEEAPIAVNSDADDIEELPVIASVQDDRDLDIQVKEEFEKSGKWKTFHDGENIARKNLINEVIKLEQSDIKPEPQSEDEYSSEFLYPKKKKKIKKEKSDRQIKQEEDSPPRRRRHDSDDSPPRRRRHDSDASPPRRRHDSDASPPRRRHDSDASPPRRRHDSDASPPRQRKSDSDASPPRRNIKEEADSDASPPRKRARDNDNDSDMSPPRKNNSDSDASPPRMRQTLDGKKAGLQNARDLKDELLALKRREKKMIDGLTDEMSGKNAKTVVRGRLAAAEAKKEEERKKKEVPDAIKEKYKVWNKGVTQVKAASAQLEDNLYEMSKSLTRTVDDTDRETLLKNVEREDDPMAAYMKKKQAKVYGGQRKFPVYKGPQPPPNRYCIMPGYRWDGVDRSNGFEKKLLTQGAAKKAEEAEWNRWSAYEGE